MPQLLVNAEIEKVGTGSNLSDFPAYQAFRIRGSGVCSYFTDICFRAAAIPAATFEGVPTAQNA
jgi:hypothetical protein